MTYDDITYSHTKRQKETMGHEKVHKQQYKQIDQYQFI